MSIVSLVKCNNYEFEEVYNAVKKAVSLAGGLEFLRNKKVLLKPNLLAPNKPEDAVTTHPIFFKAVARLVKENGGIVFAGDSPGIGTLEMVLNVSGLKKVMEEENVGLANFKEKTEVEIKEGKVVKKFILAKVFDEVDYVISIPKLKTHGMTYFTGAVKNLFGMVPGLLKPKFHYQFPDKSDFANMLVDLNLAIKPCFAIMDGITGMEGNGPRGGNPIDIGVVLASKDLTALDATACRIVGIEPENILPLVKSNERNNGEIKSEKIEVAGDSIDSVRIKKFKQIKREKDILKLIPLPKKINQFLREFLMPKPLFIHKKCVMCLECIKACPPEPKALEVFEKRIKIDRSKCIRCFCCQEMCPKSAIEPRRFISNKKD